MSQHAVSVPTAAAAAAVGAVDGSSTPDSLSQHVASALVSLALLPILKLGFLYATAAVRRGHAMAEDRWNATRMEFIIPPRVTRVIESTTDA